MSGINSHPVPPEVIDALTHHFWERVNHTSGCWYWTAQFLKRQRIRGLVTS